MSPVQSHPSSFRDPAGFIFTDNGQVYRQVNKAGQADYDLLMDSGLYAALTKAGQLISHQEAKGLKLPADPERHKVIKPAAVPFISYPYEWSFSQLKEAAQLTLEVQKTAIDHGLQLKDASAYNIQFIGKRPVFIDTLSFTKYEEGQPWEGYKQFCEHFVAPLALARFYGGQTIRDLRNYIDGIPLGQASALLPRKARWQRGLLVHVYVHGSAQQKHQASEQKPAKKPARPRRMSRLALKGLLSSLERTIRIQKAPKIETEWGDYYTFTNYSGKAFKQKRQLVDGLLKQVKPRPQVVWDLGANNGEFSQQAAEQGSYTVAFDIDPVAVERNFMSKKQAPDNMLPLVQDLTNPSPALGWAHTERQSLLDRGPADVVMALALIHHLAIGNNLPFDQIAQFLAQAGRQVIIEFVPKGDSKVQLLLASRTDIFGEYDQEHFEAAMNKYFKLVDSQAIKGSKRRLYLYKRK